MDWTLAVALVLTVNLALYLTIAMIYPEKFS